MVNSRIDKYRNLRSGLKDEAGITRDSMNDVIEAMLNRRSIRKYKAEQTSDS